MHAVIAYLETDFAISNKLSDRWEGQLERLRTPVDCREASLSNALKAMDNPLITTSFIEKRRRDG